MLQYSVFPPIKTGHTLSLEGNWSLDQLDHRQVCWGVNLYIDPSGKKHLMSKPASNIWESVSSFGISPHFPPIFFWGGDIFGFCKVLGVLETHLVSILGCWYILSHKTRWVCCVGIESGSTWFTRLKLFEANVDKYIPGLTEHWSQSVLCILGRHTVAFLGCALRSGSIACISKESSPSSPE